MKKYWVGYKIKTDYPGVDIENGFYVIAKNDEEAKQKAYKMAEEVFGGFDNFDEIFENEFFIEEERERRESKLIKEIKNGEQFFNIKRNTRKN